MTDFLLFLGKLNLAMGGAIIVIWLLRRPLRAMFGAALAYALWLLVPVAGLASLLPPRVAAPLSAHLAPLPILAGAPISVIGQIAHPALSLTQRLTEQTALTPPVIAARTVALAYGTVDFATLLFAAWALGVMLMGFYLARLQFRFHADARVGEAGPAVLGFLRPRIVMPDAFQTQYTAPEQAAILAHEHVHLARQDARVNALGALLRCLCWFNPLVHLGAGWLRLDQELACDATALAGAVSRRAYARALLKSQIIGTPLPLGCNWPGSEHPLIERIMLLKRKPPGTGRRIAGMGVVLFAATLAGVGAWAAQPPVPAKFIVSAPLERIALAKPPLSFPDAQIIVRPDDNDYVPQTRMRRAIRPMSSVPVPVTIAAVDLPATSGSPPASAPAEAPPSHAPSSVVAEKLATLSVADAEYPAPVLKLSASLFVDEWSGGQVINYCKDFTTQTVTQGANIPMAADDGVKQRLGFFYWHCMMSNTSWMNAYGDGGPSSPAYSAIGTASPKNPVPVAGTWSIAFSSTLPFWSDGAKAHVKNCAFTQAGNVITGSCTGPMGPGAASGVVDGHQVRWTWKFAADERPGQGEVDFLAMLGPDGTLTGQAVDAESRGLEAFTATPAPAQVALQK